MATVNSGGVDIDYEILNPESSATPVFFISGLGGARASWTNQLEAFQKRGPIVLHDHRGTGQSAKPLGVYSVPAMAEDVVAIMNAEGIERAHLVGSSTGGAIIQVIAIEHPSRVASAAICSSWPKSDAFFLRQFEMRKRILLEMGKEAYTLSSSFTLHSPSFFTKNFAAIAENEKVTIENAPPDAVVAERIDAIMAHDQMDRLGRIGAPTLVLVARDDMVTPPYYSEQLAGKIPGAELNVFESGGHFVYIAEKDKFNQTVLDFIQRHDAA